MFQTSFSLSYISANVLRVTDTSNYDSVYQKSLLTARQITVKDQLLGLDSMSKAIPMGQDYVDFDLTLFTYLSVNVDLLLMGTFPFPAEFSQSYYLPSVTGFGSRKKAPVKIKSKK